MHNLIYLSAASYLFSDEELIDILHVSRSNNTRIGVTGMLLYCEGSIMQILEGEKDVLHRLFNKISLDNRHKSIITMIDFSVHERSFQEWSMGFKKISRKEWSDINGYLDVDKTDYLNRINQTQSSHIITLIKSFADVNRLSGINY